MRQETLLLLLRRITNATLLSKLNYKRRKIDHELSHTYFEELLTLCTLDQPFPKKLIDLAQTGSFKIFYKLFEKTITTVSHFQQRQFNINVWCGIRENQLLGPYELPPNLNGASYLNFLQTELYDEMNTLPRNIRQNL